MNKETNVIKALLDLMDDPNRKDIYEKAQNILKAEYFKKYRDIYELIAQGYTKEDVYLSMDGEAMADIVISGDDYTSGGIYFYIEDLKNYYKEVVVDRMKQSLTANHTPEDIENILTAYKERITDKRTEIKTFGELIPLLDEKDAVTYPTGFKPLDKCLKGGYEKGRLYIVAARPGVGKTTMLENMAYNAATSGLKTCFVTLEMTCAQVMRDLTRRACIGKSTHKYDHSELIKNECYKSLHDNLSIAPDCNDIASISSVTKNSDIILVDQLSFLKTHSKTERRDLEVSAIVHELKTYALKENKIICLAVQIGRSGDSAHGGTPQLINLKESGGIEEAADVCLLMHKDEESQDLHVNVAKNRQGYQSGFYIAPDYANKYFTDVTTPDDFAKSNANYF
jgi:replicative DNA helicase